MPTPLRLWDVVTWKSQANGSTAKKWGVVVAVIPGKKNPNTYAREMDLDWTVDAGGPREKESYVVLGRRRTPDGRPRTAHYWPSVGNLKKVDLELAPSWRSDPRYMLEMVEAGLTMERVKTSQKAREAMNVGQDKGGDCYGRELPVPQAEA